MNRGDPVEYQLATDQRDGKIFAINIKLVLTEPILETKESRVKGTIIDINSTVGYIKYKSAYDRKIYFSKTQLYDEKNNRFQVGSVVAFTIQ
ncbi:hypothetical protein A3Q56_08607, partial [Intoshia linei]